MVLVLATILATWYDPGDNGFDVGDVLTICLVVAALYGGCIAAAKIVRALDAWKDRRHQLDVEAIVDPRFAAIEQRLDEQTATLTAALEAATQPIQPTTNGGLSLPDVHVTLDRIEDRLDSFEREATIANQQRSALLRIGAMNTKTITEALAALGAEIELLPFDKPDDHH